MARHENLSCPWTPHGSAPYVTIPEAAERIGCEQQSVVNRAVSAGATLYRWNPTKARMFSTALRGLPDPGSSCASSADLDALATAARLRGARKQNTIGARLAERESPREGRVGRRRVHAIESHAARRPGPIKRTHLTRG